MGLGTAEIGAMVGGLIRQGRPLPVVLTTLCELFDATVKGYSSSVLLLDRSGARVRSATGPGLPASYMRQLEGRRVSWIETPFGATINAKIPVIVLDAVSDTLREDQEAVPAAAPGLRLHEVSPILSLTGEPLGIFAVYQRESNPDLSRCHSALVPQLAIRTKRDGEDRVRLSVRDTGVGFEAQGMDRLFDAFYTTKSSGMGIGLSVSRSNDEEHRRKMNVSRDRITAKQSHQ
jgi:hypothetical protein